MSTPADIIYAHSRFRHVREAVDPRAMRSNRWVSICRCCGWKSAPVAGNIATSDAEGGHVVQALADTGYAIVRKPKGEQRPHAILTTRTVTDYLGVGFEQIFVHRDQCGDLHVQHVTRAGGQQYTPDQARAHAAASLADADAAKYHYERGGHWAAQILASNTIGTEKEDE